MKMIFKLTKLLPVVLVLGLISSVAVEDGAIEAKMNTLREECRDAISDTRYEGSKITYFTAGPSQVKSVELYLFTADVYIFAISGKAMKESLTVKIYDAAQDVKGRKLIKEIKKLNGHTTTFSSTELNMAYAKQVKGVERLKNVYIEYHIGSGKSNKEGVVLVYGSKP